MAPVVQSLTVYQGRTFTFTVQCVESDGETARDLSGYTGQMQIRETAGSSAVLGTASVSVATAEGTVTAVISAATTAGYTWSAGVYDLLITNGTQVEQIAEGNIGFRSTVTR